jgi:hypothetical protein
LTRESAGNALDADAGKSKTSCVEFADVWIAGDVRPMLSEHGATVGVEFAEGDRDKSGGFKSESEAANSRE